MAGLLDVLSALADLGAITPRLNQMWASLLGGISSVLSHLGLAEGHSLDVVAGWTLVSLAFLLSIGGMRVVNKVIFAAAFCVGYAVSFLLLDNLDRGLLVSETSDLFAVGLYIVPGLLGFVAARWISSWISTLLTALLVGMSIFLGYVMSAQMLSFLQVGHFLLTERRLPEYVYVPYILAISTEKDLILANLFFTALLLVVVCTAVYYMGAWSALLLVAVSAVGYDRESLNSVLPHEVTQFYDRWHDVVTSNVGMMEVQTYTLCTLSCVAVMLVVAFFMSKKKKNEGSYEVFPILMSYFACVWGQRLLSGHHLAPWEDIWSGRSEVSTWQNLNAVLVASLAFFLRLRECFWDRTEAEHSVEGGQQQQQQTPRRDSVESTDIYEALSTDSSPRGVYPPRERSLSPPTFHRFAMPSPEISRQRSYSAASFASEASVDEY